VAKEKDETPLPSKKKSVSGVSAGAGSGARGTSTQMARLMLVTRLAAVLLGGFVTVVGLMAVVGLVTDSFFVRLLVGLVLAIGLPAFAADRLLKRTKLAGGLTMVADVFAIVLLLIALVFVSVDVATKPLFIREGDRYARSGSTVTARIVYWIGGVSPVFPSDKGAPPAGSASASGSAAGSASAKGK
jgi:hypothetical protein